MKKICLLIVIAGLVSACVFDTNKCEKTKEEHNMQMPLPVEVIGYKIGDEANDFMLKNVDGTTVSLANYPEAKGYVVVFTCNHCPYAIAYEDRIIDINNKYAPLGYPVIAINPNDPAIQREDSFEKMVIRAQEKEFPFPYLFDEGQKVYPEFGATKTPHVFVLNKEGGKNIVRYIGAIDNNYQNPNDVTEKYLENALEELLKGNPVTQSTTVAIGCSVKAE